MRRFVKTFFVSRVAQFTVIQDSALRSVEVMRWRAGDTTVTRITGFPYAPGAALVAREAAIREARRLADQEPGALVVCPWCSGFNKSDPRHAGRSHPICPTCQARINLGLDAVEDQQQKETKA